MYINKIRTTLNYKFTKQNHFRNQTSCGKRTTILASWKFFESFLIVFFRVRYYTVVSTFGLLFLSSRIIEIKVEKLTSRNKKQRKKKNIICNAFHLICGCPYIDLAASSISSLLAVEKEHLCFPPADSHA